MEPKSPMSDSLRDIILDFREAGLPTGVPRRVDVTPVPGKATVCIGPRRAGKSTFLFQQVQKLLDRGVPLDNVLYLNFFDDRLRHLQHEGLGVVADAISRSTRRRRTPRRSTASSMRSRSSPAGSRSSTA